MAQYAAIRAVGESVLALMREACPLGDLQLDASAKFELASLGRLTDPQAPPSDGFYLVLWRVGIGGMPRNLPPRRHRDGRLFKPSLPVDLYFLLLPVAVALGGWLLRNEIVGGYVGLTPNAEAAFFDGPAGGLIENQ